MTSRRISHAELQRLLVANGVHLESPFAGVAASGRAFTIDGVEYVTAPASAIATSDVPERAAGESDSTYAERIVGEIRARRASAGLARGSVDDAQPRARTESRAALAAPAAPDMGDKVCEILKAKRQGRAAATWARRMQERKAPAFSPNVLTPRPNESQVEFARRIASSWPFQKRS